MTGSDPIQTSPERPALLVVAAPKEAQAALRGLGGVSDVSCGFRRWAPTPVLPGIELLVTGVGKACAAGALAMHLDPHRHSAVINLGVAGALTDGGGVSPGLCDVVLADQSIYGDEGIVTPDGFDDVASMGFSPAPPGFEAIGLCVEADPGLLDTLRPLSDCVGPIATVSTCSGTDDQALRIVHRTGAIAETMEGASVGFTALCVSASKDAPAVPFCEVRVISNTTGDRATQRWDLLGSMERLAGLSGAIATSLGC